MDPKLSKCISLMWLLYAPTKCEIRTISTEDPVAYVQALEPSCQLEVEQTLDGCVIRTERGGLWVKYKFTEE